MPARAQREQFVETMNLRGLVALVVLAVAGALLYAGQATATEGTGYIEVCKTASGPGVSGSFDFTVSRKTGTFSVGAGTGVVEVKGGTLATQAIVTPTNEAVTTGFLAICVGTAQFVI